MRKRRVSLAHQGGAHVAFAHVLARHMADETSHEPWHVVTFAFGLRDGLDV